MAVGNVGGWSGGLPDGWGTTPEMVDKMNIARLSYMGDEADRNLRQMQIMLSGMNDQQRIELMKDANFRDWAALNLQSREAARRAQQWDATHGLAREQFDFTRKVAADDAENKKLDYGLRINAADRADKNAAIDRETQSINNQIAEINLEYARGNKTLEESKRQTESLMRQAQYNEAMKKAQEQPEMDYWEAMKESTNKNFIPDWGYTQRLNRAAARAGMVGPDKAPRLHFILPAKDDVHESMVIAGTSELELRDQLLSLGYSPKEALAKIKQWRGK